MKSPSFFKDNGSGQSGGIVIREHVLESLLTMNHSEECDNPVPRTISNLIIHILDTHLDQPQGIIIELDMDLDSVELEMDDGKHFL